MLVLVLKSSIQKRQVIQDFSFYYRIHLLLYNSWVHKCSWNEKPKIDETHQGIPRSKSKYFPRQVVQGHSGKDGNGNYNPILL